MSRLLAPLIVLAFAGAVHAQQPPEPLVAKVKTSIHRGVDYLVSLQGTDGSWETAVDEQKVYAGGATGLAVLALLNCDGVIDDPKLEKRRKASIAAGLAVLRKLEPNTVYVRALQTMVFAEARTELAIVKTNVEWLIKARVMRKGEFIGWDYHANPNAAATDASNSQYAMLALWYGKQGCVEVPRDVWQSVHDYYRRTQNDDGSWSYSAFYGDKMKRPSVTMTVAGLCGLLIAGSETNGGREQWLSDGSAKNCGVYGDDANRAKALGWLFGDPKRGVRSNFTLEAADRIYYHLYGLERAGRLSGLRFFGEHDWYREGCEFLVKRQETNGSWPKGSGHDRWPHVNTSFALLFLSRGRTPVVISKLVHGSWTNARDERDTDWNNDRSDLRHLTEHISRGDLFGKKPVAWQTYDVMRALYARSDAPTVAHETAVVADMMQAPVLYITGHNSPRLRLQDKENVLIMRYIDSGGFIFAEACCGSKAFDEGIKEWVQDQWPDAELKYLSAEHPVWTCYNVLQPGEPYKLMGLELGCRTIMIFSPQDLSCHWESNNFKDGPTKRAFELGENIVAYATGRTPPQPRLTQVEIAASGTEMKDPRKRGYFQVGQIRHSSKWKPAPNAMRNLLEHVRKETGIDVMPQPTAIRLDEPTTTSATKFLYMHGREDFRIKPDQLEPLRFTLEYGGLLFADACCGKEAFDKAFRKFAKDLYPQHELVRLGADDLLFSTALNGKGKALTMANIKCRTKALSPMVAMAPYLEGIKHEGRWVVLYSKYDIGCALERQTSSDCVGYDTESALRIATAAVLYNVRP